MHAIVSHRNKDALITELQSNTLCTPFSEAHKVQCPHLMTHLMEGFLYCDCGTCLLPSEAARLKKERRDVLTTPLFTVKKKGSEQGARHGRSGDQKA